MVSFLGFLKNRDIATFSLMCLETVLVLATAGSLVLAAWPQTVQDLDHDRVVRLEERARYTAERVAILEGMNIDGRLRVIEQMVTEARDQAQRNGIMQFGSITGLLALSAGHLVIFRRIKRIEH